MLVLSVTELKKSYGARVILDNVSFLLNRTDRAALVGENGVGKTTLCRLILGQESYDSGSIHCQAEIGYLPQEVADGHDLTIRQFVERATGDLDRMRLEMQTLEQQMSASDVNLDAILERYGQLQDEFQRRGGYDLDYRLEQVFAGLKIAHLDSERLIGSLSGGEKTRVAMAALLLRSPELLILDEPTNHLDFEAMEWLETYLSEYQNALLVISHDRRFINKVVNKIIELSPLTHSAAVYHGNYDDYLAERERQYQKDLAAFEAHREEVKRLQRLMKIQAHSTGRKSTHTDNDKFILNDKIATAQATRSKAIRDAKQRLAVLEEADIQRPTRSWRIGFEFDPLLLPSEQPVRLENISKSYGERPILQNLNARVENGDRIVLIAPNGTGKTTLLNIIMGYLQPDEGVVIVSPGARLGYLDQEQETLDLSSSVLETYREEAVGTERDLLARLHRSGLFSDSMLGERKVNALSIGQRRKLQLASLVASRANMLLLDEPTNHLDLTSIEALETGLKAFQGALIAVSHDRWFIDRIATKLWYLEDGKIREERRTT